MLFFHSVLAQLAVIPVGLGLLYLLIALKRD